MIFFGKKPPATPETDQNIAENLYKQNRQLAITNKTLSLLRQLYQVSLSTLESYNLAEHITTTIRETLEYDFAGVFLYDKENDTLNLLASSQSQRLIDIYSSQAPHIQNIIITKTSQDSFFKEILNKNVQHTNGVLHLQENIMPGNIFMEISTQAHIKATVGYPLIIDGTVIGTFLVSLNRSFDELFPFEKDALATFADVIAIALDRSRLYSDLETSNHRQENLLHFISHEVKGYLTKNQNAFAGITEGDYGTVSPEVHNLSQTALNDTRKGIETVMQILEASNLKKGTMQFSPTTFDLKELITEVVADFQSLAQEHKLTIKTEIAEGSYTLVGDREQLGKHVFRNLVENAIRYTPTGSVTIGLKKSTARVTPTAETKPNTPVILFYTKDSGVGLSDDDKKVLFTEGGHGKDSRKVNVMSTGYGLFIAKNIVEAHHGHIWAESEGKGKGSQFYVELPIS